MRIATVGKFVLGALVVVAAIGVLTNPKKPPPPSDVECTPTSCKVPIQTYKQYFFFCKMQVGNVKVTKGTVVSWELQPFDGSGVQFDTNPLTFDDASQNTYVSQVSSTQINWTANYVSPGQQLQYMLHVQPTGGGFDCGATNPLIVYVTH